MEIDSTPVPPPQEYSDSPNTANSQQSELSMNFDYLQCLNSEGTAADAPMDSVGPFGNSSRSLVAVQKVLDGAAKDIYGGKVDDSKVVDRPFDLNERFTSAMDQLDSRVEKFRKDALLLQDQRDYLLTSIDLIKSNDMMSNMSEAEREEINCYIQRVSARLSTVEVIVHTVRDVAQEDSLSQVNAFIDLMITMGDPVISRQRCQQYLNSCSSNEVKFGAAGLGDDVDNADENADENMQSAFPQGSRGNPSDMFDQMDEDDFVDKKFESALLGCTLDDQKKIKKRLQALFSYLNKQIVRF